MSASAAESSTYSRSQIASPLTHAHEVPPPPCLSHRRSQLAAWQPLCSSASNATGGRHRRCTRTATALDIANQRRRISPSVSDRPSQQRTRDQNAEISMKYFTRPGAGLCRFARYMVWVKRQHAILCGDPPSPCPFRKRERPSMEAQSTLGISKFDQYRAFSACFAALRVRVTGSHLMKCATARRR